MVALPQSGLPLLGVCRLLVNVSELLEAGLRIGASVTQKTDRSALLVRLLFHVDGDAEVARTLHGGLLSSRHRPQRLVVLLCKGL